MIRRCGLSRSFPDSHPLLELATARTDLLMVLGHEAKEIVAALAEADRWALVLVELGTECLGEHTGEAFGEEGGNVVGFARYSFGNAKASKLIELVAQPRTRTEAVALASSFLQSAGFETALCRDVHGRIVDALVRPFFNAALRAVDEGIGSAKDIDRAIELGLGHPEGPLKLLAKHGLAAHYDVTDAAYSATGNPAFAPARQAQVAKARARRSSGK